MGSSVFKKAQRMQEQMAKKHQKKPQQQSTNEMLGLRSISEVNKQSLGEMFGIYLKEAWYFEKWYEKIILIAMGILSMWKIVGWIW